MAIIYSIHGSKSIPNFKLETIELIYYHSYMTEKVSNTNNLLELSNHNIDCSQAYHKKC